jgi:signal peptidase II
MKKSIYLVLGLMLLLIDQTSKLLLKNKNFFIFNHVENKGILLGLLPRNSALIIIITLLFIIALSYLLWCSKNPYSKLSITFIISGLLSNLLDRLFFGFVIDYIDLKFWPVFNLADTFIIFGVIGIISHIIRK